MGLCQIINIPAYKQFSAVLCLPPFVILILTTLISVAVLWETQLPNAASNAA